MQPRQRAGSPGRGASHPLVVRSLVKQGRDAAALERMRWPPICSTGVWASRPRPSCRISIPLLWTPERAWDRSGGHSAEPEGDRHPSQYLCGEYGFFQEATVWRPAGLPPTQDPVHLALLTVSLPGGGMPRNWGAQHYDGSASCRPLTNGLRRGTWSPVQRGPVCRDAARGNFEDSTMVMEADRRCLLPAAPAQLSSRSPTASGAGMA